MQTVVVDISSGTATLAPAFGKWYFGTRAAGGVNTLQVGTNAPPAPDSGQFGYTSLFVQLVNNGADALTATYGASFVLAGANPVVVAPATSTYIRFVSDGTASGLTEVARVSGPAS